MMELNPHDFERYLKVRAEKVMLSMSSNAIRHAHASNLRVERLGQFVARVVRRDILREVEQTDQELVASLLDGFFCDSKQDGWDHWAERHERRASQRHGLCGPGHSYTSA